MGLKFRLQETDAFKHYPGASLQTPKSNKIKQDRTGKVALIFECHKRPIGVGINRQPSKESMNLRRAKHRSITNH